MAVILMAGATRAALAALLLVLGLVATTGPAAGQTNQAEASGDGGREVVGTVTGQSFQDGPNGTVFTLTELETDDGEVITIRTHGGVRGDIVQVTNHQPEFTVGGRYAVLLAEPLDEIRATDPGTYTVMGGERGATLVDRDGNAIDQSE
ncbi:MAG: hypothetical protein ACR2QK_10930, partial [Acidimicrobiales bacterium]